MEQKCIIVVLVFICLIQSINPCPSETVIQPCRCERRLLQCTGLLSTTSFETILNNVRDYRITHTKVFNSSMMYLPSNFITMKKARNVEIRGSTFSSLFESEAQDVSLANYLLLEHVKITRGFTLNDLIPFKHLEALIIRDLKIGAPYDIINNVLPRLYDLLLDSNNIRELEDNCFSNLSNLENLDISNNPIKTLKRSMFPSFLKEVHFNKNEISSLPEDLFSGMSSLVQVNIGENFLTTVSKEIFLPLISMRLAHVDLESNPLDCDCNMKWLIDVNSQILLKGNCVKPLELVGRNLSSVIHQDFAHCEL